MRAIDVWLGELSYCDSGAQGNSGGGSGETSDARGAQGNSGGSSGEASGFALCRVSARGKLDAVVVHTATVTFIDEEIEGNPAFAGVLDSVG